PTLAEKLRLLFDAKFPWIDDVHTQSVWAAGELLRHAGNFNLYVKVRDLTKQEGIIFRHLLRLILLCGEFAQVCPADTSPEEWRAILRVEAARQPASRRAGGPVSTEEGCPELPDDDEVGGEAAAAGGPAAPRAQNPRDAVPA